MYPDIDQQMAAPKKKEKKKRAALFYLLSQGPKSPSFHCIDVHAHSRIACAPLNILSALPPCVVVTHEHSAELNV